MTAVFLLTIAGLATCVSTACGPEDALVWQPSGATPRCT